jgi:hypothetical protein
MLTYSMLVTLYLAYIGFAVLWTANCYGRQSFCSDADRRL